MKKLLGALVTTAIVLNMAIVPSVTANAEGGVNYDDYLVDETKKPANLIADPDNINMFFRNNNAAGTTLRDYKSGEYIRIQEKTDAINRNYAAGPVSLKKSENSLIGGIEKDKSYVISIRLKNDTYDTKPNIDFVVGYTGPQYVAAKFNVNSPDYQTYSDTFVATQSIEAMNMGFDASIDRTGYTSSDLAIINIDITNGGSFYVAEEAAYDVELIANKKILPAGDSIIFDASVLNQVDIEGTLTQNFEFFVLDAERIEKVSEGFTVTLNQGDESKGTLKIAETVAPGDYVLFAKSKTYPGFQKGVTFTVSKPVINDSPAGVDPLYEVRTTIVEGEETIGLLDSIKIKAELVNSSGEIGENVQKFKWTVLNEERTEAEDKIIVTPSGDTKEATVALDISVKEGTYYIVAESVAEESKGMRKGIKIIVDKSGTVEDIRDNLIKDSASEIEENISTYLKILEIDDADEIVKKADLGELSKIIAGSDKGQGINAEVADLQNFIKKMAIVSLYNKNTNGVELFDESYNFVFADELELSAIDANDVTLYSLYNETMSEEGKVTVQNALKGKGYDSYETFIDTLEEVLLTHLVAYPKNNGIGYLTNVLTKENIEAAGIDGGDYYNLSDKSAFHESLAGMLLSKDELEGKLKSAEESEEEGDGGSISNPPKNNGTSAPVGGGSFAPVVKQEESKEEPKTENILFDDVSALHWAYTDIYFLKDLGVISGISEKMFAPDKNITREQFLKLLIDAFKIEMVGDSNINFSDVVSGSWYEEYVKIGVANGIINGRSNLYFGVGEPITRQDVCVMLSRALKLDTNNVSTLAFGDSQEISEYAKASVSCLVEYAVIKGFDDNTFGPLKSCTRAQGAKIISTALAVMNAMK